MPRVKRGPLHVKKREKLLRRTKGFRGHRKTHLREARQALFKAGQYAYRDRRKKKAIFRGLWHAQLNAALRALGFSYSRFAYALRGKSVTVNRKVLAQIARESPAVFQRIVEKVR